MTSHVTLKIVKTHSTLYQRIKTWRTFFISVYNPRSHSLNSTIAHTHV